MGNCCSNSEDIGVSSKGMMAVGTNTTEINDDALELALGQSELTLKTKVAVRFKCADLPNFDKKSKSDPYCILYMV
jgi:hypothetical protein